MVSQRSKKQKKETGLVLGLLAAALFLAWIERMLLVILTVGGTLAGKKGLDVHTERKRRRSHGNDGS